MTQSIDGLKCRHRDAWRDAYATHADAVYGYALYRLHGNHALAEDVTQEVFLRAIESIDTYRGDDEGLLRWLRGIAKRVLSRRARGLIPLAARTLSLEALKDEANGEPIESAAQPGTQPEAMMNEEQRCLTGAALTALPQRWEEVLRMKYLQGLHVDDIAQQLSATPKAVESLLSRARAGFREVYLRMAAADGQLHAVEDWHNEE